MGDWYVYILHGVYPFDQGRSQLYVFKCPVCVLQYLDNTTSMMQIKWDEVAMSTVSELSLWLKKLRRIC